MLPSSPAASVIHPAQAPAADGEPPSVTISNPAPGQTLSGRSPVAANVHDDSGITSVQFLLDGRPIGAPESHGPCALDLRTTRCSPGRHVLSARATTPRATPPIEPCGGHHREPRRWGSILITDVQTTAEGRGTVRSRRFTDAEPGKLLLAFVAGQGPAGRRQSATVTGGGLHRRLISRANSQPGDAEVWAARAHHAVIDASLRRECGSAAAGPR